MQKYLQKLFGGLWGQRSWTWRGMCLVGGLIGVFGLWSLLGCVPVQGPNPAKTVMITVTPNETGTDIAAQLREKGVIRSVTNFKLFMRVWWNSGDLQAGEYEIPTRSSVAGILQMLAKGKTQTVKVTIPEGFTIQQIAERLQAAQIVSAKDFLAEAKEYVPYQYMYGPTPEEYHVEGFLFPDTYEFPRGTSPKAIIKEMTGEMNEKLTPAMRKEIAAKHMSIYQFVTLASIVEREAKYDDDRPIIAAVFLKRLRDGMPLQSCATIEYVIGERKPFLTEADTKIDSPYNTYRYKGLPPGPIANPGVKSMQAVLEAPETEYVYFVADKEGHHHFSKTYEEHLQTIERIYGHQ